MHDNRRHRTIRAIERIEARVQRAVHIEQRDAIAHRAVDRREIPHDERLAEIRAGRIGVHRDRVNRVVRARRRVQRRHRIIRPIRGPRGRVIKPNRDHRRAGVRIDERAARHVRQPEHDGFVQLDEIVVDDVDRDDFVREISRDPTHRIARGERVIQPQQRVGARVRVVIQRHQIHRHRPGERAVAANGHQHKPALHRIGRRHRADHQRARQRVVVHDRHRRVADRPEARAKNIREENTERLVALHHAIINQRNQQRGRRLPVREQQRARGRDIIGAGRRRAVAREHRHRCRAGRPARPRHRDDRVRGIFAEGIIRRRERQQRVVVDDRHHHIAPPQHPADRIGKDHLKRLVRLRIRVVENRHHDRLERFTVRKPERPQHRQIIQPRRGRLITRGEIHRRISRGRRARHHQRHVAPIFVHRRISGHEADGLGRSKYAAQ